MTWQAASWCRMAASSSGGRDKWNTVHKPSEFIVDIWSSKTFFQQCKSISPFLSHSLYVLLKEIMQRKENPSHWPLQHPSPQIDRRSWVEVHIPRFLPQDACFPTPCNRTKCNKAFIYDLFISQMLLLVKAGQGRDYNDKVLESSGKPSPFLLNCQIPMLGPCLFPSHKHSEWF